MLSILEAKINSVDYVANMATTAGTAAAAAEVVPDVAGGGDAQPSGAPAGSTAAPADSTPTAEASAPAPEPEPEAAGPNYYKYKEHPSFKKFFYLKSIGIPMMALAQQMRVNDLDPAVLDNDENALTDTVKPDEEGGGE